MKCKTIISLLLFISIDVFSQNLVLNPSFEDTLLCPDNFAQTFKCISWSDPTGASPDYFNSCSNNPIVSTPINYFGYSQPVNGNAYCGFILYSQPTPSFPIIREYIQGSLNQKLFANKKYCYEFKISLADSSNYSINNIGIAFSDTALNISTFSTLNINSTYNHTIITNDTSGWVTISSTFIANRNERYIVIGNFFDNSNTSPNMIRNGSANFDVAYYYIDDVSLVECNETPIIPNVFSPNDDGINDLFNIEDLPQECSVQIFDRWGIIVFESNNQNTYWNGRTTSGINCVEGCYFYRIIAGDEVYKGFLQLIR